MVQALGLCKLECSIAKLVCLYVLNHVLFYYGPYKVQIFKSTLKEFFTMDNNGFADERQKIFYPMGNTCQSSVKRKGESFAVAL